jgi:glycosyltransferase involved in cell wall biosynthesis
MERLMPIKNNPLLTIVTVNLNNAKGLLMTLKGVLVQSFDDYEHIIIDGGSTDKSVDIIKKYAGKNKKLSFWSSEPDKGIYEGMNKGILHAKGSYLLFLNSGDYLNGDILKSVPFDGTGYICGNSIYRKKNHKRILKAPENIDMAYLFDGSLPHQSCFIKKELFSEDLYDTHYRIISDWIHSVDSIIIKGYTYKTIPLIISVCDGYGISSNKSALNDEKTKWFQREMYGHVEKLIVDLANGKDEKRHEYLAQHFYPMLCDYANYRRSKLRIVIPYLNKTDKFEKKILKLIVFLCKLNKKFSHHKV